MQTFIEQISPALQKNVLEKSIDINKTEYLEFMNSFFYG